MLSSCNFQKLSEGEGLVKSTPLNCELSPRFNFRSQFLDSILDSGLAFSSWVCSILNLIKYLIESKNWTSTLAKNQLCPCDFKSFSLKPKHTPLHLRNKESLFTSIGGYTAGKYPLTLFLSGPSFPSITHPTSKPARTFERKLVLHHCLWA